MVEKFNYLTIYSIFDVPTTDSSGTVGMRMGYRWVDEVDDSGFVARVAISPGTSI